MKFAFRLCGLLLLMACLPAARGQFASPNLKVARVDIQHIGPATVSDELIRANIRVKPGDPFVRLAIDDDVENLYATGLFYNVQVRVQEERTDAGVVLTYVVQPNPLLTAVHFEGNEKWKDATLLKGVTSKVGEPLNEQKLFTDSRAIQEKYQKAGYPGTEVRYTLNIDESAGRGTATFEIRESPKIRISRVEFVGAQAFSQRELRKVVKTRKRIWLWSSITGTGVFKDEQFQDDLERLREFYRDKGYIDFEIRDTQFEHPTARSMVIRIIVYEGRQYKVGAVDFTENDVFSDEQIIAGMRVMRPSGAIRKTPLGPHALRMDVGDIFTQQGLNQDVQQIVDFYGANGYIDVPRTLQVRKIPNTETGTMDLEFRIDEGQKWYVEKIEIRGNTKTKDRVIRRELAIAPGEEFDMVRVNISKRRLEGLDYFSKVETGTEPTDILNHKNLIIGVEEKNTGNLQMGAGFSSVDAVVGFVELNQGNFDLFNPPNFTGGGQKFRLRVQLGTERQDYLMTFIEPWFLEKKLALSVDLYHRNLNFTSLESLFDEQRTGSRVGLTRALGSDFLIGSAGYTIEQVGIFFNERIGGRPGFGDPGPPLVDPGPKIPDALTREEGESLVSKFDVSIAYDTRNSVQLPDKGQRTEVTAILAGPFGGDKDFYKLELETGWYFRGLRTGHVLELGGATGVAEAFGRSDSVPFYDRWYLGGVDSLRGFRYRSVSPREPGSGREPIGGDTYYLGYAEYSVPVFQSENERGVGMRFAVFYDIGNVMADSYSYNFSNYKDNWGFGIRLNLPIGPLRLDYGIPLHTDRYNSSSGRFQFSVGYRRRF